MFQVLGLVVFFGAFYLLGCLERRRRMFYFDNVLRIFKIEKEIIINEKTKLVLSEPIPFGNSFRYDISVVFEDTVVETRSYSEKLQKQEPVSFKGPWKQDIYKVLRNKYNFYTERSRNSNVVKMKSKQELYAERYKKYVASRNQAYN